MKRFKILLGILLIIGCMGCGKSVADNTTQPSVTDDKSTDSSPSATGSTELHIGKDMEFGMTYEEVESILADNFPNLYLGEDPDVATVTSQGHERDMARFVGKEIAEHIVQVSYCYEDDRLYRVEYILKDKDFADLEFACEAFDIPYDESKRDDTGYYSVYTDDDIYIEAHPYSASVYKDESEGPFYIYYEPTYDITSSVHMGHKHTWSFPGCYEDKVCEECGLKRPSGRKHITDSYGFCRVCGADVGIPLLGVNISDYISYKFWAKNKGMDNVGQNWVGYDVDIRSLSEDYRFENAAVALYCDKIRDNHEEVKDYYIMDIPLDETGYAHIEDAEWDARDIDSTHITIISGRVHVPSPNGRGFDPTTCMHEHLTFFGRDNDKMSIDIENDEDYKAGKFHDYASYQAKWPYYAKCDDCGKDVYGKLSLFTDSPFLSGGLFSVDAETDGFVLKYKIEPDKDYTYSDLECEFVLSVFEGDSCLDDNYYTKSYCIDDTGSEGSIDLSDEIKSRYPDATGIELRENGNGFYFYDIEGRIYINDQSNIRTRSYVNMSYPDYILPDSDKRDITGNEMSALGGKEIIDRAINEIYARHGRIFNNKAYKDYFEKKDWYNGTVKPSDFDESVLNEYEKRNVNVMRAYEKETWPWAF